MEESNRSADWSKGGPQTGGPPTSSSCHPGIPGAPYPELPPFFLAAALAAALAAEKERQRSVRAGIARMGKGAMAVLAGRLLCSEHGRGRDTRSDDKVRSGLRKF